MVSFDSLLQIGGVREFSMQNSRNPKTQSLKIEGIKDIIAVASGKGGVGKSTTAGTISLHSVLFTKMYNTLIASSLSEPNTFDANYV